MGQAAVLLRNGKRVAVPVTSSDKPEISPTMSEKWDLILNLLCKILQIDVALIMKVDDELISVSNKSKSPNNPYVAGSREKLGDGLYCETVIGTQASLLVPDALQDSAWSDNPDVKHNMIAYLGFPLQWPDGELFGTLCVLDDKPNFTNQLASEVLSHFQGVVQADLRIALEKREMEKLRVLDQMHLRETFHRMKNQLCQLYSMIQLNSATDFARDDLIEMIANRLKSIVAVHDLLSMTESGVVGLANFLDALTHKIVSDVYGKKIALSVVGPDVAVMANIALTVGAIINELVTNSIKHAFAGSDHGKIDITLEDRGETFVLRYTDNGPGFAGEAMAHGGICIGLSLVRTYTQLICGLSKLEHKDSFSFQLEAPKTGV